MVGGRATRGSAERKGCWLGSVVAQMLIALFTAAAALQPPGFVGRRAVVCSASLLAPAVAAVPAIAATDSVFVGRYTDPNHPGGYREITTLPGSVGSYRLANVHGGQGKGEPASFDLPAIIVERGDQSQIIIDFSVPPKYGPRDFAGVWDGKAGGIRFLRDGNVWSKQ